MTRAHGLMVQLDRTGKYSIVEQIQSAASIHQHRTGHWPNIVYLHPDIKIEEDPVQMAELQRIGIEVQHGREVQRPLLYIGIKHTETATANP